MLVRLLYASRAVSPMSEADLAAVLRQSRRNNPPKGITGVLCHSEGVFVQMLEGSRDVVNTLYNAVVADPRHHEVTLLDYAEISERRFAGWNMGHVNLSRLNPGLVLKYSATARLDPYTMSSRALTALFDELIAAGVIVCT